MVCGMKEEGEQQVGYLGEAPLLSERDLGETPLAMFGRIGTRGRVQQREQGDPLSRLPQDLERYNATHRQTDKSESRRGGGEGAAGDSRDGVVATVVGDDHRSELPQRRQLSAVEPWGTKETGYEYDRQRFAHHGPGSDRVTVCCTCGSCILIAVFLRCSVWVAFGSRLA
jgi:hypothetical protein